MAGFLRSFSSSFLKPLPHRRGSAGLIVVVTLAALESFAAQMLIPAGSIWRYKADGSDQGSAWSVRPFDASGWPSGRAPLGFGDPHIVTTLQSGYVTYYFRRDFVVTNAAALSGLALRLLRDDGAVVYLNGTEVRRDNMPAGPVTYNTLAPVPVNSPDETTYFGSTVPANLLVNGTNIVAVEIHQNSLTSSDVGFDAELLANSANTPPVALNASVAIGRNQTLWVTLYGTDAENSTLTYSIVAGPAHGVLTGRLPQVFYTPASNYIGSDSFTFKVNDGQDDSAPATVSIQVIDPEPSGVLVRRGDLWKFHDTGINPGNTWMSAGYNDSAWPAMNAELGFGDGDELGTISPKDVYGNPLLTAYFRHTFTVANVGDFTSVSLELLRDDGAILYLNGTEVLRDNMPAGPVNYFTFASTTSADDGTLGVRAQIPSSLLVNGQNVIAVEVHQANTADTDMSFDLELLVGNTATNRQPIANDLSIVVRANTPTPITLTGFDPDGDPLTFVLVLFANRGTVSGNFPNVTYSPNAGFTGPDSFLFRVNDGALNSLTARVSIDVRGVSPPIANNQSATTFQNRSVAITLTGSDADGDPLTYRIGSPPAHGTVSGAPPNVIYTPATDYMGPDSFTFTVNDGFANSGPATVSIQVLRTPDPPEPVSAVFRCASADVLIAFNEALDPTRAEDTFAYYLQAANGTIIPALQVVARPSTEEVVVRFDRAPSPRQSYAVVVYYMCDVDGDCAENQRVPLQIDTEPPVMACDVAVNTLLPPNNRLIDVRLTASSTETNLQVQVFSDEPELSVLDDAALSNGALKLRARRNPTLDGRIYLIVITSTDACGNTGVCCRTVVVPANGTQAALDAVNAQAAAARGQCSPDGAPSTPYRLRAAVAGGAQEAVDRLIELVANAGLERKQERPLCAALNAAVASFEAGRDAAATDQLRAFQFKVRTQLATAPDLVEGLIQGSQDIIDGAW